MDQQVDLNSQPMNDRIVVVGGCFIDYIAYVDRCPSPGETILSNNFAKGFGGKGANQAVMAARLGSNVAVVSVLGEDGDGVAYLCTLRKEGINTDFVKVIPQDNTGLAMIFVDTTTAQNQIVVCPNATLKMTVALCAEEFSYRFLDNCKVLVCQNEINLEVSLSTLKEAHARNVYTIFNSAPAPSEKDIIKVQPFLKYVSLFCPNETEASLLTGVDVHDSSSAGKAIDALRALGVRDVVVTLGSQGFVYRGDKDATAVHVAAHSVKAVDTTGAGDCFLGSLAHAILKGYKLLEACKFANRCASISVTRRGTQSSFPYVSELGQHMLT